MSKLFRDFDEDSDRKWSTPFVVAFYGLVLLFLFWWSLLTQGTIKVKVWSVVIASGLILMIGVGVELIKRLF